MKIAITSKGRDLSAEIDPRFGRCSHFIIVDTDTMDFQVVENAQNLNLPQGAGIQAGKTIADNGVQALITGNCGPKAFQVLKHAGIDVITGVSGMVKDALDKYKAGELQPAASANVDGHWM